LRWNPLPSSSCLPIGRRRASPRPCFRDAKRASLAARPVLGGPPSCSTVQALDRNESWSWIAALLVSPLPIALAIAHRAVLVRPHDQAHCASRSPNGVPRARAFVTIRAAPRRGFASRPLFACLQQYLGGIAMGLRFLQIAVVYLVVGASLGLYMGLTEVFILAPVHAHLCCSAWASLALAASSTTCTRPPETTMLARIHFWRTTSCCRLMVALGALLKGNPGAGPVVGIVAIAMLARLRASRRTC
jgi:hypothetical protein